MTSNYGKFKTYPMDVRYEVSDKGWVKNVKTGRVTKGMKRHSGYMYFLVGGRGGKYTQVGRMVLETFVGPCPDGYQCDHVNGMTDDNRLENLRWLTPRENNNTETHMERIGRKIYCFTTSGEFVRAYRSATDAARDNGVQRQCVVKAANRTHGQITSAGYVWMYADVFHERFIYLW